MLALIFDVDGTLADTESVHRQSFNAAFAQAGLDWVWDDALYTQLLKVAGGKERLLHYWRGIDPHAARSARAPMLIDKLHALKTRHYTERIGGGGVPLRPGIARLLEEAWHAGVQVAIATTTTPANLDALLRAHFGATWRTRFAAIGDAHTTRAKKPAPDVYRYVLERLALPASACVAFEDSANGLLAARAAGLATIVTPSTYTAHDSFDGALAVLPHLGDPRTPLVEALRGEPQPWLTLATLRRWHRSAPPATAAPPAPPAPFAPAAAGAR